MEADGAYIAHLFQREREAGPNPRSPTLRLSQRIPIILVIFANYSKFSLIMLFPTLGFHVSCASAYYLCCDLYFRHYSSRLLVWIDRLIA